MVSYEDEKLGFYIPTVDDTYYTLDLMTLMERGMYGSGELTDVLEILDEVEQVQIPAKLLKSIGERYIGIILKVVTQDNIEVSKGEKIHLEVLHGSQTGTVYTVTPKAEDIKGVIQELAKTIATDEELRQFVEQLIGANNLELISDQTGVDVEKEVDAALLNFAKTLKDQAGDIAESMERTNFQWVLGLDGRNICKQAFEFSDGDQKMNIGFEALAKSKAGEYAVYMTVPYDGMYAVTLSYEKDGGKYSGEISVPGGLEFEFKNVSSTKSALGLPHGKYVLAVAGRSYKLDVEENKKGGTDHIVDIPLYEYDDDASTMGVSVTLHTSDKKAAVDVPKGKPKDISDYDASDFEELLEDWSEELYYLERDISDLIDRHDIYEPAPEPSAFIGW